MAKLFWHSFRCLIIFGSESEPCCSMLVHICYKFHLQFNNICKKKDTLSKIIVNIWGTRRRLVPSIISKSIWLSLSITFDRLILMWRFILYIKYGLHIVRISMLILSKFWYKIYKCKVIPLFHYLEFEFYTFFYFKPSSVKLSLRSEVKIFFTREIHTKSTIFFKRWNEPWNYIWKSPYVDRFRVKKNVACKMQEKFFSLETSKR